MYGYAELYWPGNGNRLEFKMMIIRFLDCLHRVALTARAGVFCVAFFACANALAIGAVRMKNPVECGQRNSQTSALQSLVHKVGVFYETEGEEKEDRMTESEYALKHGIAIEEVRKKYGATGQFLCYSSSGETQGTANVTVKNNIITTSAHLLFDRKTCKTLNSPQNCKIVLSSNSEGKPVKQEIRVESLIESGFDCGSGRKPNPTYDWAILKLAANADTNAYSLPTDEDILNLKRGVTAVTAVQGQQVDFFRMDKSGQRYKPIKSIGDSEVGDVWIGSNGILEALVTAVDNSSGGSGGAVTLPGANAGQSPKLIGLVAVSDETHEAEERARSSGNLNKGKFVPDKWASYAVATDGKLLAALKRLDGSDR